jgi:hypothetical protein
MLDDLDNLRERSVASPFDEEVGTLEDEERRARGPERKILGLNAAQRLVLALMLFLNVAVLGCLCLVATGTVSLPF